jgi:hypothetical protein
MILLFAMLLSCDQKIGGGKAVVIVDPSTSTYENAVAVPGVVKSILGLNGMRGGSVVTVFTTGDFSTATEPRLVGQFIYQRNNKVMEGRNGQIKLDKAFYLSINEAVNKGVSCTQETPLYVAIRRGLETLNTQGCKTGAAVTCHLWVITDGIETEQKQIVRALHKNGAFDPPADLVLNNGGINVVLCNISKRNDGKEIGYQRVQQVWSVMFTDATAVSMWPFCPTAKED